MYPKDNGACFRRFQKFKVDERVLHVILLSTTILSADCPNLTCTAQQFLRPDKDGVYSVIPAAGCSYRCFLGVNEITLNGLFCLRGYERCVVA